MGIFIGCFFFLSVIAEMSFFHALPFPFSHTPLVLLIGIIFLHDTIERGTLWLLLLLSFSAFRIIDTPFFPTLLTLLAGIALVRYFFSRRSVFGLLALGFSLLTLFFVSGSFFGYPSSLTIIFVSEGILFLLYSMSRSVTRFFRSVIYLRGV